MVARCPAASMSLLPALGACGAVSHETASQPLRRIVAQGNRAGNAGPFDLVAARCQPSTDNSGSAAHGWLDPRSDPAFQTMIENCRLNDFDIPFVPRLSAASAVRGTDDLQGDLWLDSGARCVISTA
ncbi:hypothetical protein [Tanticharoenia sakaeratensis]|uniref:hypothetical protein n=1 Tax=Tanticharoenia sakaeratensis TaxID=444053 RepID=UPI0011DD8909|nr:hypothetical protein [Tanticharoenia sakaeratensis]